jgi:ComF family protein
MASSSGLLTRWRGRAIDLLFPPSCSSCQQSLDEPFAEHLLCERCTLTMSPSGIARCPRCGMRFAPGVPQGANCGYCRDFRQEYDAVWALGEYEGSLRHAVLRGKRPTGQILVKALTQRFAEVHGEALRAWRPDLIVPTPLHWLRRVWRGANNSDTIGETLAAELKVPCAPFGLKRLRFTRPQAGLPQRERRTNVRGAFRASKRCDFREARVLLVDDILTTGATLGEMAKTVRQAGASAVAAVVLARAIGPG